MGGTFGIAKGGEYCPSIAGLAGFIKCMAKETSQTQSRLIDLDLSDSLQTIATHLVSELFSNHTTIEVAYTGDDRFTQVPVATPIDHSYVKNDFNLNNKDVILVTGGGRGVTAEVVREMAKEFPSHYVLLGRSSIDLDEVKDLKLDCEDKEIKSYLIQAFKKSGRKFTPKDIDARASKVRGALDVHKQLNYLKENGHSASYHSLDVTDLDKCQKVLNDVKQKFGAVTGLIHGAGVLYDKLITDKTQDQFQRVVSVKIDGFFSLLDLLKGEKLKFIGLFSSVAGKFGNVGQSDYAASNEMLNHLARGLEKHFAGCRMISYNWGPFDGGMVTPQLARMFKSQGIGLIPPTIGAQLFVEELAYGPHTTNEIIVGAGNLELGGNSIDSTKPNLKFTKTVKVDEDTYLKDHCLLQNPVLPMAMVMEYILEAANYFAPDLHLVKLSDLRVFKGASFDTNSLDFNFIVTLEDRLENGVLLAVDIFDENNKFKQYGAKVLLATEKPCLNIPSLPEKIDYKEFDESMSDVYENYLFHGKSLQCIKSISGFSEIGIGAILETSNPSDLIKNAKGTWISDPVILDGMAQMGLVWLGKTQGCIGIPQGFDEYYQVKPFEGNLVKCMIHVNKLDTKAFKAELDTWFFDQDSNLIAYGKGWKAIFNESFNSYTTKAKKANK
ncbi:MAG: hypothetical protein COB02_09380 [Candidatus Cloacimonadota bacterium]|nr:MAG: hypothetical protein COB02_09380 [Candidatus Cloacimonadota bacterium]